MGGGESFIQQASLTIASCGSYVNPLVLDAADGTRGGGESLMAQAGLMIASCGSYVNPGCPDAVSDSLTLSGTCSGNHSTEGRLTGDASLATLVVHGRLRDLSIPVLRALLTSMESICLANGMTMKLLLLRLNGRT